jgi:enamine deaminase RidA (YjgF/YER057c/UK114 family)
VALTIYVTDMAAYRSSLAELATVYQRHFGKRYVASALFGVTELFDQDAMVELVGVAVLPEVTA